MAFKLKWDPNNAELELSAVVMAYHAALTVAVEVLAREKGTKDLSWFDDLHQNAIRAAKGTITDQISIEAEASAVRLGFQTLDADLQSMRIGLVEQQN